MTSSDKKKIFDFSLLKRVFKFAKPYKSYFYGSLLLALLISAMAPVRPLLIQITIDKATGRAASVPDWLQWLLNLFASNTVLQLILIITVFQLVFIVIETGLRFVFSFITAWLGQQVVKDMRVQVFDKILGLKIRQFDTTPIGTFTTRTVDDIERINDIFSDGFIPIVADLLTIIFTLATMFWIDWRLSLIALIPFPLLIIGTYYFKESVNKSFIRVRNAVAALNAFVQEHLTGMQIVQAFAAEERELNKFKKINAEHRDANIKAIFAYSVFFPLVELILAVSMGLIVWWVAKLALANQGVQIDFSGKIVAFILFMNQIFRPLRVIADKFNVLQMGMIAAERVFKVLDNPDVEEVKASTTNSNSKAIQGAIAFNKVWFAYNDEQYVLKDISFTVKPGETIALVGHTGSGKTSIISLLNKLYPLNKGHIQIDGQDIADWDTEFLRSKIGVVLQDVFLFSGSVMDNITLRNPAITTAQVEQAAKMIDMHDFITQLPGGYQYNVMERGNTLSLGQRQLISFIRALLYNPSILVLDEATSSIDTESERLIQKATDTLISGRTSIVIAHRLSTIRKAHKIIVLDKGEIKEIGTHEELLKSSGFYSKLHEAQFIKKKAALA